MPSFHVFLGFLDDGSSPHWSEMTASCMLGLGLKDGEVVEAGSLPGGRPELSAACIHLGVRRARPDLKTGRVAVQWNMAQKVLHLGVRILNSSFEKNTKMSRAEKYPCGRKRLD